MPLTINESGTAIAETVDGVTMPTDFSFENVNDFLHSNGVHFEELQALCLGMSSHIDQLEKRLRTAESERAEAVRILHIRESQLNDRRIEVMELRLKIEASQAQRRIGVVSDVLDDGQAQTPVVIWYSRPEVGSNLYAAPVVATFNGKALDPQDLVNLLRTVWKHGFDAENYDDIDYCNDVTIVQAVDSPVVPAQQEKEPCGLLDVHSASKATFHYYGHMEAGTYCVYPGPRASRPEDKQS